jgi:Lrp/AsnC family transcriptional regulator, regulator for asnA, asnC and gidA
LSNERRRPQARQRLDELDEHIIEAMQENGRVPFVQLARELGVSEATIRNRYQRLCESDVLQVVGVTNPLTLGFESSALVGVRVAGSPMDVASELAGWKEASYVVVTAGQFDVLVELICSDRLHLMDAVSRVRQLAEVVSTETLVYLALVKQLYNWGVPARPTAQSLRVAEKGG